MLLNFSERATELALVATVSHIKQALKSVCDANIDEYFNYLFSFGSKINKCK